MNHIAEVEEEISLIDVTRHLLKRKWLILGGTFLFVLAAVIYSYSLPKIYEVSFVVEVGSAANDVIESPLNLSSKLEMGYAFAAMQALNISEEEFPGIKTSNPKDTKLLEVAIETSKPAEGMQILQHIRNTLLSDHGKMFNRVKVSLENRMKGIGLQLIAIDNRDKILEKKLKLLQINKDVITVQIEDIRKRINDLMKEKRTLMNSSKSVNALNIFDVSNQMMVNQKYFNDLQEKLDVTLPQSEVLMREQIQSNIIERQRLELEKLALDSEVSALQETKVIKEAAYSKMPVRPNKKLIVIVAFVFGMIFFSLLALFMEFVISLSQSGEGESL